jgi:hypothetical protein
MGEAAGVFIRASGAIARSSACNFASSRAMSLCRTAIERCWPQVNMRRNVDGRTYKLSIHHVTQLVILLDLLTQ